MCGFVYIMFPTMWQLFGTICEYFQILSTGTDGEPMIHARTVFCKFLYDASYNVGTVPDYLAVFPDIALCS
jgi:hypothetical protein